VNALEHSYQGRSQEGSGGLPPPIEMLFWDMPKTHYFSNKFSKIVNRWGLTAPKALNLQYWWPEVRWFD